MLDLWLIITSMDDTQPRLQAPGCLPFSVVILYYVILLDIAKAFQIWSTLAGYEELVSGFEQIGNGKIF